MRKEVLTEKQIKLLPLIGKFSKDFGLVGGTAIALHIGHRESIDFDLFTLNEFNTVKIKKKITNGFNVEKVFVDENDEYTVLVNGVKITFLRYPFDIEFKDKLDNVIKMANLLSLAAMKAYALGRRAKWKDYVDIYFVLKNHHTIEEITKKAKEIQNAIGLF
jgi:Nucleotidyl transferase AbiEii toxin, Type IV TA system